MSFRSNLCRGTAEAYHKKEHVRIYMSVRFRDVWFNVWLAWQALKNPKLL